MIEHLAIGPVSMGDINAFIGKRGERRRGARCSTLPAVLYFDTGMSPAPRDHLESRPGDQFR